MILTCLQRELRRRVHARVDCSAQPLDIRPQGFEHVRERSRANDHEVDIAAGPRLAFGDRAVDKCYLHCLAKRGKTITQQLRRAGRLCEQRFQFRVYGRRFVGPEAHRRFLCLAQNQSKLHERPQLPVNRAGTDPGVARELSRLKRLVRILEQQREQGRAALPKQTARQGGGSGSRGGSSQHEIKCTRDENALRAMLKAADVCSQNPEKVARYLGTKGIERRFDLAFEVLSQLPYGTWRDWSHEDSLRFHALRLKEVGLIQSNPNDLVTRSADWRFLNELKKELKA